MGKQGRQRRLKVNETVIREREGGRWMDFLFVHIVERSMIDRTNANNAPTIGV